MIDYVDMAKQQAVDCGVQRLVADVNSSLKKVRCKLPDTHEQLIVDMSTGKPRPLLPGAWTRKIFDINHELGHVGSSAMRRMICDRFAGIHLPLDDSGSVHALAGSHSPE